MESTNYQFSYKVYRSSPCMIGHFYARFSYQMHDMHASFCNSLPRTLKFRFLIEKYLDSLPNNIGPCHVIRENCRDQKVKYNKNIFKTVLRFICIFLTSKIVLPVSKNIGIQLEAKKM